MDRRDIIKKQQIITLAVAAIVLISTIGVGTFLIFRYNSEEIHPWEKGDLITVTVDTASSPFADTVDGKITGIDADILRAVFLNMDLTEGTDYRFDTCHYTQIQTDVRKGGTTIGAGGYSEAPKIVKWANVTEWYHQDSLCVVTLAGNPHGVTAANLNEKKVSAVQFTAADYFASDHYKKEDRVCYVDSIADGKESVVSGKADCLITDTLTAQRLAALTAGDGDNALQIRSEIDLSERTYFGFVIARENSELCMKVSSVLRDMKTSTTQNAIKDIIDYYVLHIGDASIPSFWNTHDMSDYLL